MSKIGEIDWLSSHSQTAETQQRILAWQRLYTTGAGIRSVSLQQIQDYLDSPKTGD